MGKDPTPINRHIKKIFEGVNAIEADGGAGKGIDKVWQIKKILSNDKEVIDLDTTELSVKTNTNVENWLQIFITKMKEALRKKFFIHYNESVDKSSKKGRIDKESLGKDIEKTLGQILITLCQIEWTTRMKNALKEMETKADSVR